MRAYGKHYQPDSILIKNGHRPREYQGVVREWLPQITEGREARKIIYIAHLPNGGFAGNFQTIDKAAEWIDSTVTRDGWTPDQAAAQAAADAQAAVRSYMARMGKRGGAATKGVTSAAKAQASRANGKLGGRPTTR